MAVDTNLKKAIREKSILFINTTPLDENREAADLVMGSRMPCEFLATSDPTPVLRIGFTDYEGLEQIREYVERYRERHKTPQHS